jgi:NADP-dependent 3-hydroxy acid dehydrogenase YdfG
MRLDRIALINGADKGVGKQVARELVANDLTVIAGSRDLARGQEAAADIGDRATALQLDVDQADSGRQQVALSGVDLAWPARRWS